MPLLRSLNSAQNLRLILIDRLSCASLRGLRICASSCWDCLWLSLSWLLSPIAWCILESLTTIGKINRLKKEKKSPSLLLLFLRLPRLLSSRFSRYSTDRWHRGWPTSKIISGLPRMKIAWSARWSCSSSSTHTSPTSRTPFGTATSCCSPKT